MTLYGFAYGVLLVAALCLTLSFAVSLVVAVWARRPRPPAPLLPGMCECGHRRCHHLRDDGGCRVAVGEAGEACACQRFIAARSRADAEIDALERMYDT